MIGGSDEHRLQRPLFKLLEQHVYNPLQLPKLARIISPLGDGIELIQKQHAGTASYRARAMPWTLSQTGRPEVAFAWKGAAQTLSDSLQGVSLAFTRKAGDNEQLFGSVTSADIAEALEAQGYHIDKRKITLADAIKVVGEYEIPVKLHREITANVKVAVKKEG